ncbi:hypothetical protein U9M48_033388 [Paspalum notatum var. saurae]|uniref:PPM-type phosphatase domain-containing protein n=1 Tax=Paspalum notatum var. saurae TaxID=547442 RepID=A0AAQ3X6J4_PASNO
MRATSVTCLPASGTTTVVLVTDGLAGARPAELETGRRTVARWCVSSRRRSLGPPASIEQGLMIAGLQGSVLMGDD